MRILKRCWPLGLLAIALSLYAIGFSTGATVLLVVGVLAEAGFWVGLFKLGNNR